MNTYTLSLAMRHGAHREGDGMDPQPGRDRYGRFTSDDANARGAFVRLSEAIRPLYAFMLNPAMDAAERERLAKEGLGRLETAGAWIEEIDAAPTPNEPELPPPFEGAGIDEEQDKEA